MLLRPPAVTLRLQRLQPFFQGGARASVPGGVRVTARRDVPLFRHGGRGDHGGVLLPGVPGIIGHGGSVLRPPNRLGRLRLLLGRELRLQRLQPFLQGGFRLRGSARGGVFLPCRRRRRGVPPFRDRRSLLSGVFTPGLFPPRPVRFVPRLQAFHQGGAARAPSGRGGACPASARRAGPLRLPGLLRAHSLSGPPRVFRREPRTARGGQRRVHDPGWRDPFRQDRFLRPGRSLSLPPPAHPSHDQGAPVENGDPQRRPESIIEVTPLRPALLVVRVQQTDDPVGPVFQIRTHDVFEPLLRQPVMLQQRAHVLVQRLGLGVQGGAGGVFGQRGRGLLHPLGLDFGGLPQEALRPFQDLACRGFDLPVSPVPRGLGELRALHGNEAPRVPHDGEAGLEALDALLSRLQALDIAVQGPLDVGGQVGHRVLAVVDHLHVRVHAVHEIGEHVEVAVDLVLDLPDLDAPLRRQHLGRADGFHRAHALRRHHLVALDRDVEGSRGSQQQEAHQNAQGHAQHALRGRPPAAVRVFPDWTVPLLRGCVHDGALRHRLGSFPCLSSFRSPGWPRARGARPAGCAGTRRSRPCGRRGLRAPIGT